MKSLTGAKITFNKAALSDFDEGQKKVLYVFAHILNRMKFLDAQIFSHWAAARDTSRSSIEQDAALCGVFESILLLAGELKEGWEAVQACYYHTQLSKTLNSELDSTTQEILKRLPRHFEGKGITNTLRNCFSYHHSPDKIISTSQLLEEDYPHTLYLFDHDNNYFDYATKLRIAAVAESLGISNWRNVIEHLCKTIVGEVLRDISHVLNAILAKLVQAIDHDHEEISLPSVPSCSELTANYFFYVDPADTQ